MRIITVTAAASIVGLVITLSASQPDPVAAATTSIDVGDFYFCAASFENGVCDSAVTAGDTVTWQVSNGFHTVTECDATFTTCPPSGGFDSGALSSGGSYSRTFGSPGTFEYECVFHPAQMRGRVLVQAATPSASPSPAASATPGGQSATPTSAAGVSPGAVPASGGGAGENGAPWWLLAGVLVSLTVTAGAASGLRATRTARRMPGSG